MPGLIQLSRKEAARNPDMRWQAMNEFLSFADFRGLSPVQKVAYLAYGYSSHLEMGGHQNYFSVNPASSYSEVVSALRVVGAVEQASILSAALDAAQAASTRASEQYDNRFLAGVELVDFIELDEAFERCARSVPNHLMDYLDEHETEFIEWKP